MKIIYLNYEYPPIGGGGGTTTKFLAENMVNKGYEIYVLTGGINGHLGIEKPMAGLTIERINTARKRFDLCSKLEMLFYIFHASLILPRRVKQFKPDMIHIFFSFPTGAVMWPYKHITNLPYIISLLGGDVPGFLPKETDKFHKIIRPFTVSLWHKAFKVVANSSGLSELAKKTLNENIISIPNGVDTDFFCPFNENEKVEKKQLKILFVGRLVPQKGLDILLKALGLIRERLPLWNLTIIGDGQYINIYKQLSIKLNIDRNINWKGWVDLKKLPEVYRNHDIFVLPSRFEGMPSVIIQAMASGCAIISSEVYGTKELIRNGENGFIIPVENYRFLSEKILELLKNHKLDEMQQNSIKFSKKFSWKEITEQYESLYNSSLK